LPVRNACKWNNSRASGAGGFGGFWFEFYLLFLPVTLSLTPKNKPLPRYYIRQLKRGIIKIEKGFVKSYPDFCIKLTL